MGSFIIAAVVFAVFSVLRFGLAGSTNCTENPFAMCNLEGSSCDRVAVAWRCVLHTTDPCSGASTIHMQNLTRPENPKSSTITKCFTDWYQRLYHLKRHNYCSESTELSASCLDEHNEVECGDLVLSFSKSAEYIRKALRCEVQVPISGGISFLNSNLVFLVGIIFLFFSV